MENDFISPPKTHRLALQPISLNENTQQNQRVRNVIAKKLQIEQENLDPSFSESFQAYKFPSKSNTIDAIEIEYPLTTTNSKEISSLPYEIYIEIFKFIAPEDLINTLQYVNKHWHQVANDKGLWTLLDSIQQLSVDTKYWKQRCLVERRSRGKIFRAVSRVTKETMAIRRINLSVANGGHDDGLPASILREISYLTNLSHPNVSKISEVEIKKDIIQICSQYFNYNLREYNKLFVTNKKENCRYFQSRSRPKDINYSIPLKNIKSVTYQILKGLSYLHHHGIIHRNLKSDNILVNEDGIVKIYDFAFSKLATIPHNPYTPEDPKDRERSGREARRLWYRAPELLLRKSKYSFETDVWAFGCLLAEMALNETLFNGETEIEQLFKIFSLIGTPSASSWSTICDEEHYKIILPKWEQVYFPNICAPVGSQELDSLEKALLPNRDKAFDLLRMLGKTLGDSGLDLLWNCLSSDPHSRSSANTLLHHKFFDEVRSEFENKDVFECNDGLCKVKGIYPQGISPSCHIDSYFKTLRKLEIELRPNPNYLSEQPALTEHMRRILVDWLVDVSVHFDFLNETLHLAINYIDR